MSNKEQLGILLSIIALVAGIISTVITYWTYGSDGEITAYDGLWKLCIIPGESLAVQCLDIPWDEVDGSYNAVRVLMIIGVIFLAIGSGVNVYNLNKRDFKPFPELIVSVGGVCILTAAIVYGVRFYVHVADLPVYLEAGFYLSIVAGLLAVLGGGVPLVYSERSYYFEMCQLIKTVRKRCKT